MPLNFLHSYQPQPALLRLGIFNIYWYGFLIAAGILLAYFITIRIVRRWRGREFQSSVLAHLRDLSFYLVIFGLIGARLYYVLSEFSYYSAHPLEILKVWRGGLGIGGAVLAGVLVILIYARKHKFSFLFLADLLSPGLIIAQALGRWGNYFNSELFGRPTDSPWGIPISLAQRPEEFLSSQYFHPCFLYESIWNLFVFGTLLLMFKKFYGNFNNRTRLNSPGNAVKVGLPASVDERFSGVVFAFYLILYCFGRFWLEFLRIDPQPIWRGLRMGQITALAGFIAGLFILAKISFLNRSFLKKPGPF